MNSHALLPAMTHVNHSLRLCALRYHHNTMLAVSSQRPTKHIGSVHKQINRECCETF